jgi:membrane protein implicated in regulation of membrane protease activity
MIILLRYLELILTVVGLLVVFAITALIAPLGINQWQVAAITAMVVGVVHGLLFWVVRRRQRNVRVQAINEMQAMLKDVINNQLTVIQGMDYLRSASPDQTKRASEQIARSVTSISDALQHLSEESLKAWRNKYARQP